MEKQRRNQKKAMAAQKNQEAPADPHLTSILDLPIEILQRIFEYMPTRKDVNLVCKKLNKAALEMQPEKNWLWIRNDDVITEKPIYNSMVKSTRLLKNVAIGESPRVHSVQYQEMPDEFLNRKWNFKAVKTVVGITRGAHIKQLQLMNIDIPINRLLELLSLTPNLKFLKLFFVNKGDLGMFEFQQDFQNNLPEITDVIIYECGESISDNLLTSLPAGSIKSFTMKCDSFFYLGDSLDQQKNIKKINLTCDKPVPVDLLTDLKLTHLTLNTANGEDLAEILSQQTELRFLDTNMMPLDTEAFKAILDLDHLESLNISVEKVSISAFSFISKLTKLKRLSLCGGFPIHLVILTRLNGLKLQKLSYKNIEPVVESLAEKLREITAKGSCE